MGFFYFAQISKNLPLLSKCSRCTPEFTVKIQGQNSISFLVKLLNNHFQGFYNWLLARIRDWGNANLQNISCTSVIFVIIVFPSLGSSCFFPMKKITDANVETIKLMGGSENIMWLWKKYFSERSKHKIRKKWSDVI